MTQINFINHSCFEVNDNKNSIVMDPWVNGSVFNNSWNLIASTKEKSIELLQKCNFIWFSHEHPDHFNPASLKILPKNKTFIFQKTKDKRVINFLKNLSDNIIELNYNDEFNISDNFSIKVFPFQDIDSYSLIKINNKTILNLNDCHIKKINELNHIKKIAGSIDVLLAQFSYAIGNTNESETYARKKNADEILINLTNMIKVLSPKYFVPFASFCYFSNKENYYLNDSINKIDETINYLNKNLTNTKILCFYPGDTWNLDNKWDNQKAIDKYMEDYKKINVIDHKIKQYSFEHLKNCSLKFIDDVKKNNNLFYLYHMFKKKHYKIKFFVTDLNVVLNFDFKKGLTVLNNDNKKKQYCVLSSDSLEQLFSLGYGYDTLSIGGRYEADNLGKKSLNTIFKFSAKNYQNYYYNFLPALIKIFTKTLKTNRLKPSR